MRVALLTDGIAPYVTGGMQRHSYYLCKYLAQGGIYVDLYHCDPQNRGALSLDCFTEEEKTFITSEIIEFPSFGKMPGHYIRESYEYSMRIYKRMKGRAKVDFIYAKGFTAWELLNQRKKGVQIPPVGVNFHGYEMFQVQPGFRNWLEAKFILQSPVLFNVKQADYLFSYGGKITNIIQGLGVDKSRIVEIPSGIDLEWLVKSPAVATSPLKFLFVGRFERRKGTEELTKAIKNLPPETRKRCSFDFVGPVPLLKRVPGCVYHGEVTDKDELQKIYRTADILIVPSHSEGMPNVILEAMASGLAIAATDVGAVSSLVDDSNGWLIEGTSVAEIEKTIKKVLNCDESSIQSRKMASLNKVQKRFNWEDVGAQTIEFLRSVDSKSLSK